jgi:hypothetical protein
MSFEMSQPSPPATAAKPLRSPLHTILYLRNTEALNNTVSHECNTISEINPGCRKKHPGGVTPN